MPVSEERVGRSLAWASSHQGDPFLPWLAASDSSDTATLYPVHERKDTNKALVRCTSDKFKYSICPITNFNRK